VMSDPYVGKLTYFRVYSGKLKAGDRVLNTTTGKTERVGRILQMHANHREEREEIGAGEIAAGVGLKATTTGDTPSVESAPIVPESMTFPDPVISVAVEPKSKADQDKLGTGLSRLAEEDPTFRVTSDDETGQTLIAGMGELHLEIIVDRLMREFKVDANVGRPQVAYRETAGQPVQNVQGRFVRQTGGSGQYGDVIINLCAQEAGAGYEFVDRIVGGKIPREYIKPVDDGIQEAMNSGVLAGYPVVDVKVELVEGSYHEVDSSERAFKIAGSLAFKEAMKRAKPKLLEPMMAVEVVTPEEYLGDVMGNLSSPWSRSAARSRSRRASRSQRCSGTPPTCARCRRVGQPSRCNSTAMRTFPARSRAESSIPSRDNGRKETGGEHGQAEVRAQQAARQRRHDRSHRPRQDDAHRCDHQGARGDGRRPGRGVRRDRQGARGEAARHHDQHGARRVRDGEQALRPRRLPGPR